MGEANNFEFDAFLCHSDRDAPLALSIAQRLQSDGLKVWLPAWNGLFGLTPSGRIQQALERSRSMIFLMSTSAFGAQWPKLEARTFAFRDPQNSVRRLILLRLDESRIDATLARLPYITWRSANDDNEQAYLQLIKACSDKAAARPSTSEYDRSHRRQEVPCRYTLTGHTDGVISAR
jgi:hypothetical protein